MCCALYAEPVGNEEWYVHAHLIRFTRIASSFKVLEYMFASFNL